MATNIRRIIHFDIELTSPLQQVHATPMTEGDRLADVIEITLYNRGDVVDHTGLTATANVELSGEEGVTVRNPGTVGTGKITIPLHAESYAVPGSIRITVTLTSGSTTRTVLVLTGYVEKNGTGAIIDPSGTIPNLDDLLAQIERMEAATNAANAAANRANAAATRAEQMQLDASGMAGDSNKLGGKAPEYYLSPRNLLDNSDFTNPVNQRGVTAWQDKIGIDRWYSASEQASVMQVGIRLAPGGRIYQLIDHSAFYAGKTLTFAAFIYNKGVTVVSAEIPSSLPSEDTLLAKSSELPNVTVAIKCGSSQNIYVNIINTGTAGWATVWAALYEGAYTAATLPPYVPKGYAAELMECQRYYQIRSTNNVPAVDMRPLMRISNPTVKAVAGGYSYDAEL